MGCDTVALTVNGQECAPDARTGDEKAQTPPMNGEGTASWDCSTRNTIGGSGGQHGADLSHLRRPFRGRPDGSRAGPTRSPRPIARHQGLPDGLVTRLRRPLGPGHRVWGARLLRLPRLRGRDRPRACLRLWRRALRRRARLRTLLLREAPALVWAIQAMRLPPMWTGQATIHPDARPPDMGPAQTHRRELGNVASGASGICGGPHRMTSGAAPLPRAPAPTSPLCCLTCGLELHRLGPVLTIHTMRALPNGDAPEGEELEIRCPNRGPSSRKGGCGARWAVTFRLAPVLGERIL